MELAFPKPQEQRGVQQDGSLDELTMPRVGATSEVRASTPPSSLEELSNAQSFSLRDIASSTPAEELAFYQFQVNRQQSSFNSAAVEMYAPGSLPEPRALLKNAA